MLNSSSPSATVTATATAAAVTAASAATTNPFLWNVDELTPVPPPPPPPQPLSLALGPKTHSNTQPPQPQPQQHLPNYAHAPTSQLPFSYYARTGNPHYGSHTTAMRERNFDFYRRGEQFAYEQQQQQQLERRLLARGRKSARNNGSSTNRNNQNSARAQVEEDPNEAILLSNDSDDEDLPTSGKMPADCPVAVEKYLNFEESNKEEVKITLNKQGQLKSDASDIAAKIKEEEKEALGAMEETAERKRQKEESNCQEQTAMNNMCNNDNATLTNTTTAPACAELGCEKLKDVAGCENVAQHVAQVALD